MKPASGTGDLHLRSYGSFSHLFFYSIENIVIYPICITISLFGDIMNNIPKYLLKLVAFYGITLWDIKNFRTHRIYDSTQCHHWHQRQVTYVQVLQTGIKSPSQLTIWCCSNFSTTLSESCENVAKLCSFNVIQECYTNVATTLNANCEKVAKLLCRKTLYE